jgi:hypothetical protein
MAEVVEEAEQMAMALVGEQEHARRTVIHGE